MLSPIDLVMERLKCPKRSGDSGKQWTALCPAHDDNKHSLGIGIGEDGRVLLKCYRGCSLADIARGMGLTERDLFPAQENSNGQESSNSNSNGHKSTITVDLLALDKRIPADWLESNCGVFDTPLWVAIPYFNETRVKVACRRRKSLRAKDGTEWTPGDKSTPYGLWRLGKVRENEKYIVIVEGESDCWTLWLHGFPALGIPGASNTKCLGIDHLSGIDKVYIWKEPDEGGEVFIDGIARHFKEIGWTGQARLISGGATKDANDLHQKSPDDFKSEFQKILDASVDLPEPTGKAKKISKVHTISQHLVDSAHDIGSIPCAAPGYFDLTDAGNSLRLKHRFGNRIHYVHQWNKWMIWDEMRWTRDDTGEIVRLAMNTAWSIVGEAQKAESVQQRDELILFCKNSQNFSRLKAMENLAQSLEGIPISSSEWDRDPMLFNVLNGTIDLTTGSLCAHNPKNLISKIANVVHDSDAECPTWNSFLHRIMDGKKDLIDFLRVAAGYSLTGCVDEKCFFFLYGNGDNGKSCFIEILSDLMNDYYAKSTAETLLSKSNYGGVPNDIARLVGMRMVTASEMPAERTLDEAKVKDLTGRDTISARFMRAEWFDFRPCFKLWMYGNHRPRIKNADEGIWRRVKMVPFDVVIPKSEQDPKLPDKLRAELPGILNWAIRGCLEWQRCGLPMPDEIKSAVAEYKSDMDQISPWVEERCFVGPNHSARPQELYNSYENWASQNGIRPISNMALGHWLKRQGFTRSDGGAQWRTWKGIGLNPTVENNESESQVELSKFDW